MEKKINRQSMNQQNTDKQNVKPQNDEELHTKDLEYEMMLYKSLRETYNSMYDINIADDIFMEIMQPSELRSSYGETGSASARFDFFCDNLVLPEYSEKMRSFVDLSTLDERLRNSKTVMIEYLSTVRLFDMPDQPAIWMQACFIEGVRDENGRLTHVIFAIRSIHEAKIKELEAKKEIREANIRYATLLEEEKKHTEIINALGNIYSSMLYVDLQEKILQRITSEKPMQYTYGVRENAIEAINDIVTRYVAYDFLPAARCFLDIDTIDERLGQKAVIVKTFMDINKGWHRCSIIPIKRDESGKNMSVLLAIRNVTSEIETLQSQDQLIQALAIPYENTYTVNGNTGETFCYHMGQDAHEIYEQKCKTSDYEESLRIYSQDNVLEEDRYLFDQIRFLPRVIEMLSVKKTYSFIYRIIRRNQLEYFQCQLVMPNPDRKEFVIAFRNVSDEKRQELEQQQKLEAAYLEAEAASKAKTNFLFSMSHDIRTPMNAIIGFTNLLEKYQDDEEKRKNYLEKIKSSNDVLLSIINNVLEMARIESGRLDLNDTVGSVEQFDDNIYSMFHEMMDEKGIEFNRSINVKNSYIYCDQDKLRDIFINILSNAYKYTNSGGRVNVSLNELPYDKEGYTLFQTTVSDTGIGMDEGFLPHLFEEFAREQSTTDNKIAGTGLGMPIVKRLVEIMDGTIEVSSKKGVGSTFIVTIPHRIAEKTNFIGHVKESYEISDFTGKRVLLAEDNDLNAEIAIEILEEVGFDVERAQDGDICCEILAHASENFYDLVLMDIQMPNMNGYDATRKIRNMSDPSKAGIPIVAMTANAFEEDKRNAFSCGMNGHIAKPINIKELMKELSHILSKVED